MDHSLTRPHSATRITVLQRIRKMMILHRQRRDLRSLNNRLLNDIGVTEDDAHREAGRPIWDVPSHWMR